MAIICPPKHCVGCNSELPPMKHQGRPRKWCSQSCRIWAVRHPGEQRQKDWQPRRREDLTLTCAYTKCGKAFVSNRRDAKYCSLPCSGRGTGGMLSARYAALRAERASDPPGECSEIGCERPRLKRGRICGHCLRAGEDPERVKARQRRKTHRRKMRTKRADLPLTEEIRLRAAAKRCPLCRVRLINEPYMPASKELDHIVPLNQGGAHSIWNVRIICRTCNVRRPKDGSDAVQVPLFALEVA